MIPATDRLVDGGALTEVRVRGPVTGGTSPVHFCRHCGTPLAAAAVAGGFCCAGCAYVFQLVHAHGLGNYYKIRDAIVPPAGPVVFQPRDYAWLAELQAAAEGPAPDPGSERTAPPVAELILEVQGISCAGCVWLIEKVFHEQPGALHIETDAQLGRMRLRWARGRFDAPAFARALQSFNYLAGPPGEEPAVPESRLLVRRVGLGAAFSMNVMLFTLPAYFGMEASFPYARLFGTLAMLFATLSVLTGGSFFIARAARALRAGVMHIDLPIAVGIVGAYAGSLYGWLSGRADFVYFDFVAAFILLMLVGRWAQVAAVEHNRRRLLTGHARPHKVRILGGAGAPAERPVTDLCAGDLFAVRSGQVVPVEAQLESAAATVGTAWITGEAEPRECRAGTRVPAGSVNLGRDEIRLRAVQPWAASLLAQLLRPAERDAFRHSFLERIISGYLIGIFVVASAAGLGWWLGTHDPVRTWSVVTAVLVVSCPCAIGLAFPLADEMATVALRRVGVFVREADLWPRLARIRKIIFDKTGTLTLETPVLRNADALAALSSEARAALLALVRDNSHPVSQSLYENLRAGGLVGRPGAAAGQELAGEIVEQPGLGVTLQTPLGLWSLGRPGWRGGQTPSLGTIDSPPRPVFTSTPIGYFAPEGPDAEFACDGVVLARFAFADAVRSDAPAEIARLQADGFAVYILSGDRGEKVAAMARALALPSDRALAGVTPAQKADWIRALDARDTLMLGDGANDSLAFDAAFARGTPVIHRGLLESKADFYYLGNGLAGLRQLFAVNAARRRTQLALLVFSVAYNALAVGLAATGHMNPLLAAMLMPASSLLTLAIVGAGMRPGLGSRRPVGGSTRGMTVPQG
jgi:Cu2+-exporting ATPase